MLSTRKWTDEMLIKAVADSKSLADVLRKLNLSRYSGNYRVINKYIKLLNLDVTHFASKGASYFREKIKTSDILVKGSNYNSYNLKKRLIKENLIDGTKCSICGDPPNWKGKPLIFILDHINGDPTDNQIENLRLICPNCNSQLDTHCGKNRKKHHKCSNCGRPLNRKRKTGFCADCVKKEKNRQGHSIQSIDKKCLCGKPITNKANKCRECFNEKRRKVLRPDMEIVQRNVEKLGFVGAGKLYGVSDNAIRKWLKPIISSHT